MISLLRTCLQMFHYLMTMKFELTQFHVLRRIFKKKIQYILVGVSILYFWTYYFAAELRAPKKHSCYTFPGYLLFQCIHKVLLSWWWFNKSAASQPFLAPLGLLFGKEDRLESPISIRTFIVSRIIVLEFQTDQSKITKFEEVIRSRKWKDRQHNGQKG
jgi:hypothetical protein